MKSHDNENSSGAPRPHLLRSFRNPKEGFCANPLDSSRTILGALQIPNNVQVRTRSAFDSCAWFLKENIIGFVEMRSRGLPQLFFSGSGHQMDTKPVCDPFVSRGIGLREIFYRFVRGPIRRPAQDSDQ